MTNVLSKSLYALATGASKGLGNAFAEALTARRIKVVLAATTAIGFTAIAAIGLAASDKTVPDPRMATPLVRIATVQPASLAERAFTGEVAARVQSNLGFRVAGKITERLVDSGQTVHAGQALMRIDRTDFIHAVAVQTGNVAAAKARFVQAAADETRYSGLVESGAVSKSAYDQVRATADSDRALLETARAQLKVAQDEGDYATLLADADGTVVDTEAESGQVVSAGQVVVRLAHAGPREAVVALPETVRPSIGSQAEANLFGSDARTAVRLRQLSDSADPLTRTYEARYVLQGPAAQAPLGATATVYLPTDEPVNAVVVPLGAIDDEGTDPGVWVLDSIGSSVSFRPVQIQRVGTETAILNKGIKVGEQIVAMGGHMLHNGEHVRATEGQMALK